MSKASAEINNEGKSSTFKRRNVVSLKKSGIERLDYSRKSEFEQRRPNLRPTREKKPEHAEYKNEFHDFKEGDNYIEDNYQAPDMSKLVKSEKYSPRTRKRFQMKNEQLHPIKPLPMEVPANKEPLVRLEKKPSKKLVIKANDKIPEPIGSGHKEKKL